MALKEFHEFLVAMSKHRSLRDAFAKDPAGVGAEAGLTSQEISLLQTGSESEIRRYIGDEFSAAGPVRIEP
jgi:hypothetical protein